jgi:hypothetical protein
MCQGLGSMVASLAGASQRHSIRGHVSQRVYCAGSGRPPAPQGPDVWRRHPNAGHTNARRCRAVRGPPTEPRRVAQTTALPHHRDCDPVGRGSSLWIVVATVRRPASNRIIASRQRGWGVRHGWQLGSQIGGLGHGNRGNGRQGCCARVAVREWRSHPCPRGAAGAHRCNCLRECRSVLPRLRHRGMSLSFGPKA